MLTMSQIAEQLGLTRQTVSAVMNNRYKAMRISEETAQRVREEAARFGYLRNHLALAIRTQQNNVIGCLISKLPEERVSATLSGLVSAARTHGYLVKIEDVEGDQQGSDGLIRLIEQRVAALFCCNFHPSDELVRLFAQTVQRYNVPAVACASNPSLLAHHIVSDDASGCDIAVQHLWNQGHRRIAFLGAWINKTRMDGFIAAMNRHGVKPPPEFVVDTDWSLIKGTEVTTKLLGMGKLRPTAIFCANDRLAAAVIREARRLRLQVPKDLSVIGFSGSSLCESLDPPLTSVAQPFELMGSKCAQWIDKALAKTKSVPLKPTREQVGVKLLEGKSTAIAPKL